MQPAHNPPDIHTYDEFLTLTSRVDALLSENSRYELVNLFYRSKQIEHSSGSLKLTSDQIIRTEDLMGAFGLSGFHLWGLTDIYSAVVIVKSSSLLLLALLPSLNGEGQDNSVLGCLLRVRNANNPPRTELSEIISLLKGSEGLSESSTTQPHGSSHKISQRVLALGSRIGTFVNNHSDDKSFSKHQIKVASLFLKETNDLLGNLKPNGNGSSNPGQLSVLTTYHSLDHSPARFMFLSGYHFVYLGVRGVLTRDRHSVYLINAFETEIWEDQLSYALSMFREHGLERFFHNNLYHFQILKLLDPYLDKYPPDKLTEVIKEKLVQIVETKSFLSPSEIQTMVHQIKELPAQFGLSQEFVGRIIAGLNKDLTSASES